MIRALVLLSAVSCATVPKLEVEESYKKETVIELDGTQFRGVANVLQRPQHHIKLELPQKPDLLKIASCHREVTVQKPGKRFEYVYKPNKRETMLPCPLSIVALDEKGENSWAMISFRAKGETLKARVDCNGDSFEAMGSALCQAKTGLIQTVEFNVPVDGVGSDLCPELQKTEKGFDITVGPGVCQYVFSDGKEFLRLMIFGYSEVLIYD